MTWSRLPDPRYQNLTGQQFGKWTVLRLSERGGTRENSAAYWWCRCECGYTAEVQAIALMRGRSLRCKTCYLRSRIKKHGDINVGFFEHFRYGAEKRGISFNLTIEEAWQLFLKQDGRCALSGVKLTFVPYGWNYRHFDEQTASLDRIDSSDGYHIGNVQWVHKEVNFMKGRLADEEFIKWCKRIARHAKTAAASASS